MPDALSLGDHVHVGDTSSLAAVTPLNARDVLVAPVTVENNVRTSIFVNLYFG